MAALDPTEEPEADDDGEIPSVPRSTLKLFRARATGSDTDEDIDDEYLQQLLAAGSDDDDEDDSEDDEAETNGGPSDPAKSKKQKNAEALAKLMAAVENDDEDDDEDEEESDEEMVDAKPNGVKPNKKGKEKALADEDDEDDEDDSDDSEDSFDMEPFTICTLDTQAVSRLCATFLDCFFLSLLTVPSSIISSPLTSPSWRARRSSLPSLGPTLST